MQTCATSTYERDDGEETHDKDQRVLVFACEGKVKSPSMTFEQPAHQSHVQRTFSPRPASDSRNGNKHQQHVHPTTLGQVDETLLEPRTLLDFLLGCKQPRRHPLDETRRFARSTRPRSLSRDGLMIILFAAFVIVGTGRLVDTIRMGDVGVKRSKRWHEFFGRHSVCFRHGW